MNVGMLKKLGSQLAFLLFSVMLFQDAVAGCSSSYIGKATINEVYHSDQSLSPTVYFVEVKVLQTDLIGLGITDDWTINICSKRMGGCTGEKPLSLATVTSPFLTLDQNDLPAGYVDLGEDKQNNPHGMEITLKDVNGDLIDYLSVDGYSVQGDGSCSYQFDTDAAGSNSFDLRREPDGTGDWGGQGGASGGESEGGSNDDPEGFLPGLTINDALAGTGETMLFTVSLTGGETAASDITINYQSFDNTAIAGTDYTAVNSSVQIPTGQNSNTIPVEILPGATIGTSFSLFLTSATNATISNHVGTGTITGPSIGSFSISPNSASASTCSPKQVAITVLDDNGNPLTNYDGTVSITTSSGRGNWSVVTATNSLVPSPHTSDDGSVQYTFDPNDNGQITLALANVHADELTITVTDSSASPIVSSTSGTYSFQDNAFVINTDPIQVAGRPQTMSIEMWRKDPTSGNCYLATDYSNATQSLKVSLQREGDDPGAPAPAIAGNAIPDDPSTQSITLDFSADPGRASFNLDTTDVGKYILKVVDDTRSFTNADIISTSDTITTRPFALGLIAYQGAVTNPSGTASSGSKFIAAASIFSADLQAYIWESNDDSNNDGNPDGGADITDNQPTNYFAWDTTISETAPYTPFAPTGGQLSGSLTPTAGDYYNGLVTVTDLKYDEVGSFTLLAQVSNYLNSGINLSASSVVGRIYPAYFTLDLSSITAGCGTFTYMGQDNLGIAYSVSAKNNDGNTTQLYDNDDADPVLRYGNAASPGMVAENNNDGTDLGARLTVPAMIWSSGNATVNTTSETFSRDTTPDGRYDDLQIALQLVDTDGVTFDTLDMRADTSNDCTADLVNPCDARKIGTPTDIRFGRMYLEDAYGSEFTPLIIPLRTEYYDTSAEGFQTNSDDSCSSYNSVNASLSNYTGNLSAGETTIVDTASDINVINGLYDPATPLKLTAPGADNTGAVDITHTVPAWLRYDWDIDGLHDNNPTATATFGRFRGNDRIIFWREVFN